MAERMTIEDDSPRGGGFSFERVEGEIPPPPAEEPQPAPVPAGPPGDGSGRVRPGRMPIMGAAVKPPLRLEGHVLKELTGWEGWLWSEQDLDDICQMVEACGLEASPFVQLMVTLATMHGARAMGYLAWRRTSRARRESGEELQ